MSRTALVTRLVPSGLRTMQVLVLTMFLVPFSCFPSTDSFLVVRGRVVSTQLKYSTIGKQTGTAYTGTITVRVLETLKGQDAGMTGQRNLVLTVNEQNKRPTWETDKQRDFIFAVEPIPEAGRFRAVSVVFADPEVLRRVRQRDFASLKDVVEFLERNRDENQR